MNYYDRALELKDEIIANRRYIHTNAEVGLHMPKAKAYVIEKLREYGLEPKECGEGVTATVGNGGKVIQVLACPSSSPAVSSVKHGYSSDENLQNNRSCQTKAYKHIGRPMLHVQPMRGRSD